LERGQIVEAAINLLDEDGLEGLTLRRLASRLGIQAPSLYWHIRDKAELMNEVGEAILREGLGDVAPPKAGEAWQDWLTEVAVALRRSMHAHRDGARVVSAAHLSPTMAGVAELVIRTLVEQGMSLRQARLTYIVVQGFTIGHVLEEQAPPPAGPSLEEFDLEQFSREHPMAVAAIREYFEPGRTVDDLFRDAVELICR
jgi:TetR/AcrR family tetracycline transcriptional repressor